MIKMSKNAHQALEKIIGSILRTYGLEALLTSIINELGDHKDEYISQLSSNLQNTLSQYQQRYLRN